MYVCHPWLLLPTCTCTNVYACVCVQVAKNLANTYGDKAPEVAKLASLTGRRWPVLGQSVHFTTFTTTV